MPRIRCHYEDCIFLDEHGYCTAAEVEIDPDRGCLTFQPASEVMDGDWDEDLGEGLDEDLLDEELLDGELLDDDDDLWDDDEI